MTMIFRRARLSAQRRSIGAIGGGDASTTSGEHFEDTHDHNSNDSHVHNAPTQFSFLRWLRQLTTQVKNWGNLPAHHKLPLPLASMFVFTLLRGAIATLILFQLHAFVLEYQGPLDYVSTSFSGNYLGLFCPDFSSDEGLGVYTAEGNSIAISIQGNQNTTNFPRIFMIGARDEDGDTFHAWQQMLQLNQTSNLSRHRPRLERINTLTISNQYATQGGALRHRVDGNQDQNSSIADSSLNQSQNRYLCRKIKWEHRLFAVYQSVFSNLLTNYPNDPGFVIVEDDALLRNPHAFVTEVSHAQKLRLEFYSLYRSSLQLNGMGSSSCVYLHGTVAFYIQRSTMETIVNERRRGQFCRFPIDMYIAKLGPWYATQREIVGHLDMGRVGST